MKNESTLLTVESLIFSFHTYAGEVQAVRGVSFQLEKGQTLGIVGESGCGKSVTAKSIVRLNPDKPSGEIKNGRILFDGKNITELTEKEMQKIRAKEIRMIFQDPMTSLNPTMTIGKQIAEGIIKSGVSSKEEAKKIAIEALTMAGIPSPEERYDQFPHEFSGGMRQRAMIALAMAINPKLLIADEPTTALDVTTQAQILNLIKKIQKQYDTAIIMITHDLGVVSNIADKIAVMYAGKVVEYGNAEDIFEYASHPYTWGIMQSIPPEDISNKEPLKPILGTPPDLLHPPKGCAFAARCPYAMKVCRCIDAPGVEVEGDGHKVWCWLYDERAKQMQKTVNPITGKEV